MKFIEVKSRYILSLCKVAKRRVVADLILSGEINALDIINDPKLIEKYSIKGIEEATVLFEEEMEIINRMGFNYSVLGDKNYPQSLYNKGTPPFSLRWVGNLFQGDGIAIVGSRAATRKAMESAFNIAKDLSALGFNIISGGAYGVDAAAHRGAIENGKTLIFLGSGLCQPYPKRHLPLFSEVVSKGGSIVSTLPIMNPPVKSAFIQRNTYMAHLSKGVIVVAAKSRSGALYTAQASLKANIPLFVIPGTPGCDLLLSEKKGVIYNRESVLALKGKK
jgi:DNA processing protein